jgi:predicted O-methyltransferase YrrM
MPSLKGLQARLTVSWEKLAGKLVERQPEALSFATHIAVLTGLARINKIENILELGCGRFSTLTFTNRDAFPHLKNLRTVENNPQWAKQIRAYVATDTRVEFVEYKGHICSAIREMNLGKFDLIFIDDSMDADQRASTIVQVSQNPGGAIVVMHDFENIIYRRASKKRFENVFRFTALNPNTGVAWAGNRLERPLLRRMNKAIRQSGIAPDDIAGWVRLLNNFPAASR